MHGVEGGTGVQAAGSGAVPTPESSLPLVALQSGAIQPPEFVPEFLLVPGWRLVVAAVVVVLAVVLSKYVVRLLGRPVARQFTRQSVAQTVLRIVRLAIILSGIGAAANILGLELGNIVLSVTVFSAVLGIVLAPIVGSVVNGVFVLADQPYEIGDMIELDNGTRGFVEEINLRYTKVFTLDNTFLVMPNSNIRNRDVVNYSAEDERTRLTLDVLVTYESDISTARNLVERAARDCEEVLEGGPDIRIGSARYPAKPTAYIESYADNGVLLRLRYWAMKPYKMLKIQSEVQTKLWSLLEDSDANVEFAYPHTHLVFDETSGAVRIFDDESEDGRHVVASPPGGNGDAAGASGASDESSSSASPDDV
ncbi:mechanosensitive ion channel [Haloferax mucosum ATCC BAA-1512]|uniref:Mechanosensitive ion channel n=1 Tax=Haloferax mucosum ATCC BAA-1512 TaxID=662479 RepID=M0IBF2_9EURY|nr:mechanosensitive ion channel family protein [Haloferax mucosum]ELZ94115.1 mechanosensitive ion channel [Haloferax mucosum ATCC BAA-1512]